MTVDRPVIEVPTPAGGWADPWPNVAEAERLGKGEVFRSVVILDEATAPGHACIPAVS